LTAQSNSGSSRASIAYSINSCITSITIVAVETIISAWLNSWSTWARVSTFFYKLAASTTSLANSASSNCSVLSSVGNASNNGKSLIALSTSVSSSGRKCTSRLAVWTGLTQSENKKR